MTKFLISLVLLTGCDFGVSAAATTRAPGAYCEPVTIDSMVCRSDGDLYYTPAWRCHIRRGAWTCGRVW